MKNTIIISGPCGSGKTTLALFIKDILEARGFTNITVDDEDVNRATEYRHLQDRRLEAIQDNPIVIDTHQLPRRFNV